MSLVNDVLRDLEKRQAPDRQDIVGAGSSGIVETSASGNRAMMFALLLLVILVLGLVYYIFSISNESNTLPVAEAASSSLVVGSQTGQAAPPAKALDVPAATSESNNGSSVEQDEAALEERVASSAPENLNPYDDSPPPGTNPVNTKKEPAEVSRVAPVKAVQEKTAVKEVADSPKALASAQPKKNQETATVTNENDSVKASPDVAVSDTTADSGSNIKTVVISEEEQDRQAAQKALDLLSAGEQKLALRSMYEFIEVKSVDVRVRSVLAGHLLKLNRLAEAGDIIIGAGDLRDYPDLRALKARWFYAKDMPQQAIRTLNENPPPVDAFPDYYSLWAAYAQQAALFDQALDAYNLLLQTNEYRADWWAGRAIASESLGQMQQAKDSYNRALQLEGMQPSLVQFVESRLVALK